MDELEDGAFFEDNPLMRMIMAVTDKMTLVSWNVDENEIIWLDYYNGSQVSVRTVGENSIVNFFHNGIQINFGAFFATFRDGGRRYDKAIHGEIIDIRGEDGNTNT